MSKKKTAVRKYEIRTEVFLPYTSAIAPVGMSKMTAVRYANEIRIDI